MLLAFRYFFQPYTHIFDDFYLYLQDAIGSGDTCELAGQFNQVFFELYLASYVANPNTNANSMPNTPEYRQCFYNYFLDIYGLRVATSYQAFASSFNRTMYYIRALRTADRVIESILRHRTTRGCDMALFKMTHCSQCAGFSELESPICPDYCLNTMRGCLIELASLIEPLKTLTESLLRMREELETNNYYNLWNAINLLDYDFLTLATDIGGNIGNIQEGVSACDCRIVGNFWKVRISERSVQIYWVKIFGGLNFGQKMTKKMATV